MNGKDLEKDLARFLENEHIMVWTQLPLGPVQMMRSGIADVVTAPRSFSNFWIRIYEVKISRADFQQDVRAEKYKRYFPHCSQLLFATPKGMITRAEIPDGCGLITLGPNGWRTQKMAPFRKMELDQNLFIKLLIRGSEEQGIKARQLDRKTLENIELKWLAYDKGHQLAKKLAGAEDYMSMVDQLKVEIEAVLGAKHETFITAAEALRNEVKRLLGKRQHAAEAVKLAEITMALFDGHGHSFVMANRLREIADELSRR